MSPYARSASSLGDTVTCDLAEGGRGEGGVAAERERRTKS